MKTIKGRVSDLENGIGPKPILILWGDVDDSTICRVGNAENADVLQWAEAEERFGHTHQLIAVRYVDDWRPNVS